MLVNPFEKRCEVVALGGRNLTPFLLGRDGEAQGATITQRMCGSCQIELIG